MNKLVESLKKFITNKNTVTILGVIIGVGILYFGYQKRVNDAINPISVPYAKTEIKSGTIITSDMIGTVKISSDFAKKVSIYTKASDLIGKSVNVGSTIPAGSIFYTEQVVEASELPDAIWESVEDGKMIFYLDLGSSGLKETYGNSIGIGEYLDIYAYVSSTKTYGPFVTDAKIVDIRDSQGNSITNGASPAILLFEVDDDIYELLIKASIISGIELTAVPSGHQKTAESGETSLSSSAIKEYILNQVKDVVG